MIDIFDFWKNYRLGDRVHLLDRPVLDDLRKQHSLNLNCLPLPFYGALKTAPIVLLYLNPGLSSLDEKEAGTKEAQERMLLRLEGNMHLSAERAGKKSWWVGKVEFLGLPVEAFLDKLAVLELCAYRSKEFKDGPLISALPSSRAAISWAQGVLFPEAHAGKRVVICLRSSRYWGLAQGSPMRELYLRH
jgi:hypothetical protein